MYLARTAQGYGRNPLGHTGFKPHCGTGRDVEPMTVRGLSVELQRRVGLRQVHMAADLYRAIAAVDDVERQPGGPGVDLDLAVAVEDFTRLHEIGWWTVTS